MHIKDSKTYRIINKNTTVQKFALEIFWTGALNSLNVSGKTLAVLLLSMYQRIENVSQFPHKS